ncbi:MAG: extensin family protein [Pseudomonadota bacterium]
MKRYCLFVGALLLAGSAWAEAPTSSLIPIARPGSVDAVARTSAQPTSTIETTRAARSPVPKSRPGGLRQRLKRLVSGQRSQPNSVTLSRKGSVCGVPEIRGESIAPIPGRIKGCGVADPVKVTAVAGVALSTPITVDCTTAQALNSWVDQGVKPAVGRKGGGVASLKIAAHYACRTRNHKPGAKISEHGRGRAVDISAINLADGTVLPVLGGWRDKTAGPILRKVHQAACGPFGTVLGPNADRHHQDHFHFDTARYRSGTYCK